MPAPALPARKAGGMRKGAPASGRNAQIMDANEITLEDGTKIPVRIPQGMPPAQAEALLAYLKANPEAAKAAQAQAQQILKNPSLAHAFMNMQSHMSPENTERFAFLKDDPDLQVVFEDVKNNGPAAMQKYWDDEELMAKINAKMRAMQLQKQAESGEAPKAPAAPTTLFDAAKMGDVEAAAKMIEEGADVNAKNDKGITALGVSVGFNRKDMVKLLIEKGADIEQKDGKGNTVLHYAAGYGRKEVAEILIAAGAKLDAANDAKQTPLDVAKLNKEKQLVDFLKSKSKSA